MSDAARDQTVGIFAREFLAVGCCIGVRSPVGIALKGYCGHGYDRTFGEPPFQVVVTPLAFGHAEPPTVIMDRDCDMIRVVESRGRAIEGCIIEVPLR